MYVNTYAGIYNHTHTYRQGNKIMQAYKIKEFREKYSSYVIKFAQFIIATFRNWATPIYF